jgi:hypothetical protein
MPNHRKPTHLHLIEGTLNATRHKDRKDEPVLTGKPSKPKFLRGRASKLWDEYVAIGYWLTEADSHAFAIWCSLTAEAERGTAKMTASRLSQLRSYGGELGFSGPGNRSRINVGNALGKGKGTEQKTNAKDPNRFFTKRSS